MLTIRRKKQRKKVEKYDNKRKTRAHALIRIRERRAAADFAFCSRCFFYASYCLSFSALFQTPSLPPPGLLFACPRPPHAWRARWKTRIFFFPFFLHDTIMPPNATFEAFAPGLYYHRRHLWCKSKRIPSFLILFFCGAALHWPIDETYLKIGSLNSRFLYVLTRYKHLYRRICSKNKCPILSGDFDIFGNIEIFR